MRIPSPYRNYPPGWSLLDDYMVIPGPAFLGFVGSAADINRFVARYRVAKCFKKVEFEELTVLTAEGYTALVQLLLTYSAFEHFMRCIGVALKSSHALLSEDERTRALLNLRRLNGQAEFFRAVRKHLDPPYQRQIDALHRQEACNPLYLAAGIRHAFAHGMLTETLQGVPERTLATVCGFLCRVLFRIMDREFQRRADDFEGILAGEST